MEMVVEGYSKAGTTVTTYAAIHASVLPLAHAWTRVPAASGA